VDAVVSPFPDQQFTELSADVGVALVPVGRTPPGDQGDAAAGGGPAARAEECDPPVATGAATPRWRFPSADHHHSFLFVSRLKQAY